MHTMGDPIPGAQKQTEGLEEVSKSISLPKK